MTDPDPTLRDNPIPVRPMHRDDIKRLHALCVAYLGHSWATVDVIIGSDVVVDGSVQFDAKSRAFLTDEGHAELARAVAGMRGEA